MSAAAQLLLNWVTEADDIGIVPSGNDTIPGFAYRYVGTPHFKTVALPLPTQDTAIKDGEHMKGKEKKPSLIFSSWLHSSMWSTSGNLINFFAAIIIKVYNSFSDQKQIFQVILFWLFFNSSFKQTNYKMICNHN